MPSSQSQFVVYTDGACSENPGPGGYAAIIAKINSKGEVLHQQVIAGGEPLTTNNRMEIRAAVEGLKAIAQPASITVISDSQYLINTMTKGWKRNKNHDLWAELDSAASSHQIQWKYTRGHAGNPYNERCDRLAVQEAEKQKSRRQQSEI